MAKIPITMLNRKEWESLVKKYGDGKVKALGKYDDLKAEDYPGHDVARGKQKPKGDGEPTPTGTGYLRSGSNVKGSVSFV